MTREPWSKPIPEQKDPVKASKERIQKATEFFETHFDLDGNPITKYGLLLHYRHSNVVYFPVKEFRVFKESNREEP